MKIFSHVSSKESAITHYRVTTPLNSVEDVRLDGETIEVTVDDFHPSTSPEQRLKAFAAAHLVQCHAALAVQLYETIAPVVSAIPEWDPDADQFVPSPAFVIDFDDLYTEIDHLNPAFSYWGSKRPDGSPLCIGDKITVDTMLGDTITLWEDDKVIDEGPNQGRIFSVASNHRRIATLYRLMDEAQLVTVSTPRLAEEMVKLGREGPVYVYPNSVNPEQFPDVDLAPHVGIRVLWQGGYSHHADLFTVRESIGRLSRKYPEVKWIFFGQRFPWIENAVAEDKREFVPWVNYSSHRMRMATVAHDIAICPIAKTLFNDCKSAIKWYESSLRLKPAAICATNWGAYRDEIVDGETGMLYNTPEEFEAKMSILIENARLRQQLGENAKKWILTNRHARQTGRGLAVAYRETIERHRANSRRPLGKSVNFDGVVSALHPYMGTG